MDNFPVNSSSRRQSMPATLQPELPETHQGPQRRATMAPGDARPANLHEAHLTSLLRDSAFIETRSRITPLQRWNSTQREKLIARPVSEQPRPRPSTTGIDGTDQPKLQPTPASTTTTGPREYTPPPTKAIEPADTVSESRVSEDSESTDEEFGNLRHPYIAPQTRSGLEAIIFKDKTYTTLHKKHLWETAKRNEDAYVQSHRAVKYSRDLLAGAANQAFSFAIAGSLSIATGNPWIFPIVAAVLSDLVGDKLAQLIRLSTIVPDTSKEHFENHRRLARALGDVIAGCADKPPKKSFLVTTGTDTEGQPIQERMTAADALRATGLRHGLNAWGLNLLTRGLPFIWFSGIYMARDYYLNYQCGPAFSANQTAFLTETQEGINATALSGCPDPQQTDTVALRWGLFVLSGLMSGALTMVSNQLIASRLWGVERTNYSAATWKLQADYLESARADTKAFLDEVASGTVTADFRKVEMSQQTIDHLVKAAQVLDRVQEKELAVAVKKSSAWTTYQGELDQATQKHRDETLITPEFTGKRLDTALSIFGKMLSLLSYAYAVSYYNQQGDDDDKLTAVIMIPLALIVIGGYAFRDDFRLVGHLPYGALKGVARALKKETRDNDDMEVVVANPGIDEQSEDDDSNHYDGSNAASSASDKSSSDIGSVDSSDED